MLLTFSSDVEEDDEEYHFDDVEEEEEPMAIKSDHEFSPESDLETDSEAKPIRHARTAQKGILNTIIFFFHYKYLLSYTMCFLKL